MKTYTIATLQPAPSMSLDTVIIEVESYAEAVRMAQDSWRKTGRNTTLHSGKSPINRLHRIEGGVARDFNMNSGIPEMEELS